MNRKLAKFLRDPKLFFADMWEKRVLRVKAHSPKRTRGNYRYCVVSAVYNVEKYLNHFFESLVGQRLDFVGNIRLVMVDDGSSDQSAAVIEKWRKRFPKNIIYVRKDNGGQASARNVGLSFAKGDFVTFIDPDDFLDPSYFISVDNAIKALHTPSTAYVATRLVMYLEDGRTYRQHPLNAKFPRKAERISLQSKANIQLSSASAFFRLDDIKSNSDLYFPEDVKPSWEDAYFINNLAITLGKDNAILVPEAQYFYRRRADGTSTVDRTWDSADKYSTVLQNGYLRMLERAKAAYGVVPANVQHLVMYDVAWYIKRFVWNPREFARLPEEWQSSLKSGMRSIFQYIDKKTIEEFHTAGFWYMYKKGIIDYYEKGEAANPTAYVRSIDASRRLFEVVVYDGGISAASVKIDGHDRIPSYCKRRHISFLGEKFVEEKIIWIGFLDPGEKISIYINGRRLPLVFLQNSKVSVDSVSDIIRFYKKGAYISRAVNKPWMFMDRDLRADDNAEHFYRYVMTNHPEQEIYYALDRTSPDWERLGREGFNLVDFSSSQFGKQLGRCSKFLSSHNYRRQIAGLNPDIMDNIDFVFLQHGVTQNDVSTAFNAIKIDTFVAASDVEAKGIAADGNGFKLSYREVISSGFPRHDALVESRAVKQDCIVIMPTWREYLAGSYAGSGMARTINVEFLDSQYLREWRGVLNSIELKELALSQGKNVVFIPHPEVVNYLDAFEVPEYIRILQGDGSIQEILRRASIYITDYSSVAFDAAFMDRPSIYFQFDEVDFYSRHYMRGYFNYRRDGFGPVVGTREELVNRARLLLVDPNFDEEYKERRGRFFPVRDGKNCERLYTDLHRRDGHFSQVAQNELHGCFAKEAEIAKQWDLAEERWTALLVKELKSEERDEVRLNLARALYNQGKFSEAAQSLKMIDLEQDADLNIRVAREYVSFHMLKGAWKEALEHLDKLESSDPWVVRRLVSCYASLGDEPQTRMWIARVAGNGLYAAEMASAWCAYARKDWAAVCDLTNSAELLNDDPEWHLRRARAFRLSGKLSRAHAELVSYETVGVDTPWRSEVALLAFSGADWGKTIRQLELAFPDGVPTMPAEAVAAWLCSSRHLGAKAAALATGRELVSQDVDAAVRVEIAELAMAEEDFDFAISLWDQLQAHFDYAPYRMAHALVRVGRAEEALAVLTGEGVRKPSVLEEWTLVADTFYLNGEYKAAINAFNRCVQFFGGRSIP
ncbi:CDP-glycerol glycerophosphotransferase family protein, partial [Cupriavidus taiwanensis]|uniref:CDP-glycerol glycerophosphotransferase family protein n=1 Tax=Cupriavidus taiwanensis TaxID=164546 RepID=UPI0011C1A603